MGERNDWVAMTTKREKPPTPMNLNHVHNLCRHQPTTTTTTITSATISGSAVYEHQKAVPPKCKGS